MKKLVIVSLIFGSLFSEEPNITLPKKVKSSESEFNMVVEEARKEYYKTVKLAAARCLKILEEEMNNATKRADLELAIAIKEKIKSYEIIIGAEVLEILPPADAADAVNITRITDNGNWSEIIVDAQSQSETEMCSLKKEQIIYISYVSGEWSNSVGELFSPEINKGVGKIPLFIFRSNNQEIKIPIRGPTIDKPFEFVAPSNGTVAIRINDPPSSSHDNQGSVIYKYMKK